MQNHGAIKFHKWNPTQHSPCEQYFILFIRTTCTSTTNSGKSLFSSSPTSRRHFLPRRVYRSKHFINLLPSLAVADNTSSLLHSTKADDKAMVHNSPIKIHSAPPSSSSDALPLLRSSRSMLLELEQRCGAKRTRSTRLMITTLIMLDTIIHTHMHIGRSHSYYFRSASSLYPRNSRQITGLLLELAFMYEIPPTSHHSTY